MEVSKDTDEFDYRFYSFRMGKDREMDDGLMNVNEGLIVCCNCCGVMSDVWSLNSIIGTSTICIAIWNIYIWFIMIWNFYFLEIHISIYDSYLWLLFVVYIDVLSILHSLSPVMFYNYTIVDSSASSHYDPLPSSVCFIHTDVTESRKVTTKLNELNLIHFTLWKSNIIVFG